MEFSAEINKVQIIIICYFTESYQLTGRMDRIMDGLAQKKISKLGKISFPNKFILGKTCCAVRK